MPIFKNKFGGVFFCVSFTLQNQNKHMAQENRSRIAGYFLNFTIQQIKKEAEKEKRSDSQMMELLILEALEKRYPTDPITQPS